MDLRPYVEDLHRQLAVAAEAGGEDARALADRLVAPLDAAFRLALQDVLAVAAEEITCELAPGSVELRLRGRDPEFVVTPPAGGSVGLAVGNDEETSNDWPVAALVPRVSGEGDEGGMSRINLRMPDQLKHQVEEAASGDGLSVNAWLVRAVAAGLARTDPGRQRPRNTPRGGQHYTGWAR
jgi:hypothetical protein